MWRRVAVVPSSDFTAWSSPAKMFVWPIGWIPAIAPPRSAIPPRGCVRTTQWALSSKATIPSWSRADIAAAARRMASLPMSTLRTPAIPDPEPRSKVLQWQASIEPDLSMTTTSATSGCFWRSFTPMSTGSASSTGVSV